MANEGVITLSTTSKNVLPPRYGNRLDFSVVNTDTTTPVKISLLRGEGAAVAGQGIVLNAGESWTESTDAAAPCYQGPLQAVAASGTPTLAYSERVSE